MASGRGLTRPVYMVSKGLQDISREGLAPETTDTILAPNGTDDTLGEAHLVPATPYADSSGAPPTKQPQSKLGGVPSKT
jgi:hypothetical protein